MASESVATLLLRVTSESGEGKADLAEFAAGLEAVGGIEAHPEVDLRGIAKGLSEVAAFTAALEALDRKDIKVDVSTGGPLTDIVGRLGELNAAGEKLRSGGGIAGFNVAANRVNVLSEALRGLSSGPGIRGGAGKLNELSAAFRAFESIGAGAAKGVEAVATAAEDLAKGSESAGGPIKGLFSSLSGLSVNIGAFGGRLGPITAGLAVFAGVIAVSVVGALAALAASFALAAAGAAALGIALVAALGPLALLAIPVMLSLTKIMKVLQAEQQASIQKAADQAQADQRARTFAQQRADAIRNIADAERGLKEAEGNVTDAVRNEAEARIQAYKDWEDAIERVSDAQLALEHAQLGRQEAALGIRQAERDLQKFRQELGATGTSLDGLFKKFSDVNFKGAPGAIGSLLKQAGVDTDVDKELKLEGLILAVKEARLRQKDATDAVGDSTRELGRAQEGEAKFQQEGIKASPQYASALKQVASAHEGVRDATRRVADSVRSLRRLQQSHADEEIAAQRKVEALTGKLNSTERALLGTIKEIWPAVKDAFGPAVQGVINGFIGGLRRVPGAVGRLKSSFGTLGTVVGTAFADLATALTSPQMLDSFDQLIGASAQIVPLITGAFAGLLPIILQIAQTAMPPLVAGLQALADWLQGIADNPDAMQSLSDFITGLIPHLTTWLNLFGQIGAVFLAFIQAAAPDGQTLAAAIAGIAQNLAEFLNSEEGRREIQEFLDHAIPLAKEFGTFIWRLVQFFIRLMEMVEPVLTPTLNLFNSILDILQKVMRFTTLFTDALGPMNDAFAWAMGLILGALGDLIDKMYNIGRDIVNGIIRGIKSMGGTLVNTVKDEVSDKIQDFITKPLGIGSPSKVTHGFGRNIMEGLIQGMASAASDLSASVGSNIVMPIVGAGSGVRPAGSSAAAGAAGGGGVHIGEINLPPAPGAVIPDGRYQAAQLMRELERRAG